MSSPPSEVLAHQVKRWRMERRLSAQDLANRLAELGSELNRRVISKIENGERGVTLNEWLQLAHALAVPPVLLLVDLDSGADVAVAPGVVLHPWLVLEWVTGVHPPVVPSPDGGGLVTRVEEFGRAQRAIQLYRQEGARANALQRAKMSLREAEFAGDQAVIAGARATYVEALRGLAEALDEMVEHGMAPPAKPREWIETIRELELSKYPGSLAAWEPKSEEEGDPAGGRSDQAD